MADSEEIKNAVTHAAIQAVNAAVLVMLQASEENRVPATATREAKLGRVARLWTDRPSLR